VISHEDSVEVIDLTLSRRAMSGGSGTQRRIRCSLTESAAGTGSPLVGSAKPLAL
jgi:hypothetical protein